MLHIVLTILKIIGIFFAAVLAIVLLLLLFVLFVPLRYKIKASRYEEEPQIEEADTEEDVHGNFLNSLKAKVRISWLFHIIDISYQYENQEGALKVRLFGIPLSFQEKEEKPNKVKKEKRKRKKSSRKKETDDGTREKSLLTEGLNSDKLDKTEDDLKKMENPLLMSEEKIEEDMVSSHKKKKNRIESIKKKLEKLKKKFIDIVCTTEKAVDKIKALKDFIDRESNKAAFLFGKKQLGYLLKHIKPGRFRWYLRFGTGDPALTGQILAILSIFYSYYGKNVDIQPDFEQAVFESELYMKGRIRTSKLLWIAYQIYRDKNIKGLTTEFRALFN